MAHYAVTSFVTASKKTIDFLHDEFRGLQTGIASPSLVENISIDAYGSKQPLKALANIGVEGGQSLLITPWDKGLLTTIEKSVREEPGLGLAPINDGAGVRLNIPPLTKERREELTKVASKMGEEAKVTIRKHRHDAMDTIKKDEELSEDMEKGAEKDLQNEVDNANKEIDNSVKSKQESIMKV